MTTKTDFKRDIACYQAMFTAAVEHVAAKGRPARVDDLRLETLTEGLCVQALHVGSYDDEAELLRRMHHEVIPEQGFTMLGKHHEIYLSGPRKVEPSKPETIPRQPVATDRLGTDSESPRCSLHRCARS